MPPRQTAIAPLPIAPLTTGATCVNATLYATLSVGPSVCCSVAVYEEHATCSDVSLVQGL